MRWSRLTPPVSAGDRTLWELLSSLAAPQTPRGPPACSRNLFPSPAMPRLLQMWLSTCKKQESANIELSNVKYWDSENSALIMVNHKILIFKGYSVHPIELNKSYLRKDFTLSSSTHGPERNLVRMWHQEWKIGSLLGCLFQGLITLRLKMRPCFLFHVVWL